MTKRYLKFPYKRVRKTVKSKGLASKILVVDFDVHHGNGTQRMFEDDSSVGPEKDLKLSSMTTYRRLI